MKSLFFPNYDFEDELSGRSVSNSPGTRRALEELAPLIGLLGQPGDAVLVSREISTCADWYSNVDFVTARDLISERHPLEIVPWGWSDSARTLAAQMRCVPKFPSAASVYKVNSRSFSADVDTVFPANRGHTADLGGHFGRLCSSLDACLDMARVLKRHGHRRWIAKAQISHAARNRLIADDFDLNAEQQGWLEKNLRTFGAVYVEPWVVPTSQCGIQFHIHPPNDSDSSPSASIEFTGIAELLTDRMGRFLGSVVRSDARQSEFWRPAIEHGRRICERAADSGYYGPMGIDAMAYRGQDGDMTLRMANDINGRLTMGRLAIASSAILESGECCVWWQTTAHSAEELTNSPEYALLNRSAKCVRSVWLTPRFLTDQPVRMAAILLATRSHEVLSSLIGLLTATTSK